MSGVVAAVAGGVAVGGIASSVISSNAQQSIAEQQLSAQQKLGQQALGYASATPQELASQQSQLSMATQSLNFAQDQMGQYALMQSQISPTFSSAFSQIQGLLQGQQVGYTSPYFKQLDIQRQQMNNGLQNAMGSGYGSSSAGLQAQALFGQQAGLGAMNVTNNALNTLSGLGTSAANTIEGLGQAGSNAMGTAANINNQYAAMLSGIQTRQISGLESTSTVPYQGANQIGSLGMANGLSSLGGTAMAGLNMYNTNQSSQNLISALSGGGGGGSNIGAGIVNPNAVPATQAQFPSGFTPS